MKPALLTRARTLNPVPWVGAWLVCLVLFVAIGTLNSAREAPGTDLDLAKEMQSVSEPAGDILQAANLLGGNWRLFALTAVGVLALVSRSHFVEGAVLAASAIPRGLQALTKLAFDTPRPTMEQLAVTEVLGTPSYPSGHVVGTTVVFTLFIIFVPLISRQPWFVLAVRFACFAMIGLVPLGRVWSGAHWPSDVMGGWLFAALWLTPVLWAYQANNRRKPDWKHSPPKTSVIESREGP